MFASLLTLALVCASTLTAVVAEDFTVDTPTLTQCESTTIAWQAGQGDVNLIAVDPSDPCGEVLHDFGDFNSTTTSVKWVVPFPAGTKLQLSAENAAGDEAWSGSMTVGNSSTTSCLPVASASASASVHATSTQAEATTPLATVGAAGAAVTGGSSSSDDGTPLGAASGGSSGASGLYMNPFMVLSALFAVAVAL